MPSTGPAWEALIRVDSPFTILLVGGSALTTCSHSAPFGRSCHESALMTCVDSHHCGLVSLKISRNVRAMMRMSDSYMRPAGAHHLVIAKLGAVTRSGYRYRHDDLGTDMHRARRADVENEYRAPMSRCRSEVSCRRRW